MRQRTLISCMRRAVILFLLFLLPLEVFAGIAYELKLAHEAKQEINLSVHPSAGAIDFSSPLTPASSILPDADPDLLLDLGEAFDLPCAFTEKPPALIASPPGHATYCDKSIVTSVPTPPAI